MGCSTSKEVPGSLKSGSASVKFNTTNGVDLLLNQDDELAKFLSENKGIQEALQAAVRTAAVKSSKSAKAPLAIIAEELATASVSARLESGKYGEDAPTSLKEMPLMSNKGPVATQGVTRIGRSTSMIAPEVANEVFDDLAGNDGELEFDEFAQALKENLVTNLSDAEIERVWCQMITSRSNGDIFNCSREEVLSQRLTRIEFCIALRDVSFLRHVASSLFDVPAGGFEPPSAYNFQTSTNDNYSAGASRVFTGQFASIREGRDYSYHVNYTPERQAWQDWAIQTVVARTKPQSHPWVVYTCGPMGAGKGYALSWMSRNGYFPLENIVCIDPDHFADHFEGVRARLTVRPASKPVTEILLDTHTRKTGLLLH